MNILHASTETGVTVEKAESCLMPNDSGTVVKVLTASDLHQSKKLYQELSEAVVTHKPDVVAIVGDCLHSGEVKQNRITVAHCADALSSLPCKELVFVRGNHEEDSWAEFETHWQKSKRALNTLHGQVFQHGPLVMVGFPCLLGWEGAFVGTREELPFSPDEWLRPLMRAHGAAFRSLWLMHEPPRGTPLSEPTGPIAGNQEWTDAVMQFSPVLVVCGHDHRSPICNKTWHTHIGSSTCVNVGQTNHGPLHYTVINASFAGPSPSLPKRITVTAFPNNDSVRIPK